MRWERFQKEKLESDFSLWLSLQEKRGSKPRSSLKKNREFANSLLNQAQDSGSVSVYRTGKKNRGILLEMKPKNPRVRGERVLFFEYHPSFRKGALLWLRKLLMSREFPKYTRIGLDPADEEFLGKVLLKRGFSCRWELYQGNTEQALRLLKRRKNPPKDLKHLFLKLAPLKTKADLNRAIQLQRSVFLRFPKHGNFSHTKTQLAADLEKYKRLVFQRSGLLVGIHRSGKMVGFFGAGINGSGKNRVAGLTFCFRPEIQGLGITRTAYLVLLNYLKKKKIRKFFGGTSQPAIQKLARVMKREKSAVIYMKASWKNSV